MRKAIIAAVAALAIAPTPLLLATSWSAHGDPNPNYPCCTGAGDLEAVGVCLTTGKGSTCPAEINPQVPAYCGYGACQDSLPANPNAQPPAAQAPPPADDPGAATGNPGVVPGNPLITSLYFAPAQPEGCDWYNVVCWWGKL
jgi:hypothetical protein